MELFGSYPLANMIRLEVRKEKENYRVSLFSSKGKKGKCQYWNIIDKDPNKIALIFMDLYLEGFPIDKAYRKFKDRVEKKDWMGF